MTTISSRENRRVSTATSNSPSTTATTTASSTSTSAPDDEGVEAIGAVDDGGVVVASNAVRSPGFTVEGGDGATMGRLPPTQRAAASTFSSIEEARSKLERDFGVVVADGPWQLEELSRIHESLSLAGKVERAALKGVELRREAAPSDAIRERHEGNVGAFFDRGDAVDDDGARISRPSITFYDAGFPDTGDARRDRRTSQHVVLHELGHVIEGHAIGDALAEANAGNTIANAANAVEKGVVDDYNVLRKSLTGGLSKPPAGFLEAVEVYEAAHKTISDETSTPAQRTKALKTLQAAQATTQRLFKAMDEDHPARDRVAAFVRCQLELTAAQPGFVEGRRRADAAENKLEKLVVARDVKETPHDETLGRLENMLDDALGDRLAMPTLGEVSPVEDFANAYALYRRDPDALKAESPEAWAFFKKHVR